MSNKHVKDKDIWYAYLRAHLDERTRNLHYAGTLLGIGIIFSAIIAQEPLLALIGLLTAYGLAWFGHFTIENNQPAAFKKPILSFLYNFKMLWLWLWLKGEVDVEFEAAVRAKEQA
jgi:hypothetical protein